MSRHNHFYDPFLVFLELDSFLMNYDEVTKYYCVENSYYLFSHIFLLFLLQSSYELYGLYVICWKQG